MKVIVRPRQCGKSHELIKYAHESGYHILVAKSRDGTRLYNLAQNIGYPISRSRILTASVDQLTSKDIVGIVIDDVDLVLGSLLGNLGNKVKMITISGVPEHEYDDGADPAQYLDFVKYNPDLTFGEFCKFKYGMRFLDE